MDKSLYPTRKVAVARALRREPAKGEHALWWHLRDRRVAGVKFRRQCAIGPYIADFACMEAKLVIEIDGPSHDGRLDYDLRRTAFLEKRGFRVLRFAADDVAKNLLGVVDAIAEVARERKREL
jgi:very-short-patch-repair endonuclease